MIDFIIVDDEKYTCTMLAEIIDWESEGYSLSGTFYNGKDALEFVSSHPVDLVITDINMPKMSGIDLTRELCALNPNIYIIFISAYRDFEYARQALSLSVKDYITKPIVFDQFKKAVNKAKESLAAHTHLYNAFLSNETSLFRKQFFCDCFSGLITRKNVSALDLEKIMIDETALDNPAALIEIIIDNFTENLLNNWKYEPEQLYMAIQNMLPSETDDFYVSPIKYTYNRIQFLLLAKAQNVDFSVKLNKFTDVQSKELFTYLKTPVTINTTATSPSLFGLYHRQNSEVIENIVRTVISHMAENNSHETHGAISLAFNIFSDNFEALHQLCMTLYEELGAINISADSPLEITDKDELLNWAKNTIEQHSANKNSNYDDIIKKALDYIHNNYKEFITLESVSAHVSMNPGYFSTYFKNRTGEKFIDYLVNFRIEKAKSLIESDPDIKSTVLCDLVGYKSVPYFYKIFRSFTGMTPSEYKEKVLNK